MSLFFLKKKEKKTINVKLSLDILEFVLEMLKKQIQQQINQHFVHVTPCAKKTLGHKEFGTGWIFTVIRFFIL